MTNPKPEKKNKRKWSVNIGAIIIYEGDMEPNEDQLIKPIKRFISKAVNTCNNYTSVGSKLDIFEIDYDEEEE